MVKKKVLKHKNDINTHLCGQARGGPVSTHMPFRVKANPVAAFLFLMDDLWPTALQRDGGVASRVCCGLSIMAHTTEGGGGIYVVLTTADKPWGWLTRLMTDGWRITFSFLPCPQGKQRYFFVSSLIISSHFFHFHLLSSLFLDLLKCSSVLFKLLAFRHFSPSFLSSIMAALNISPHLLLSPQIYILLFPPSSPLQYSSFCTAAILSLYCQELSRRGSVFFRELTVIADVFLPLLHLQQQGDIYNTRYHSILL